MPSTHWLSARCAMHLFFEKRILFDSELFLPPQNREREIVDLSFEPCSDLALNVKYHAVLEQLLQKLLLRTSEKIDIPYSCSCSKFTPASRCLACLHGWIEDRQSNVGQTGIQTGRQTDRQTLLLWLPAEQLRVQLKIATASQLTYSYMHVVARVCSAMTSMQDVSIASIPRTATTAAT